MELPKRTYIISISRNPPISGYGGWDEWTLESLPSNKAMALLEELEDLVEKHGGQFTGG